MNGQAKTTAVNVSADLKRGTADENTAMPPAMATAAQAASQESAPAHTLPCPQPPSKSEAQGLCTAMAKSAENHAAAQYRINAAARASPGADGRCEDGWLFKAGVWAEIVRMDTSCLFRTCRRCPSGASRPLKPGHRGRLPDAVYLNCLDSRSRTACAPEAKTGARHGSAPGVVQRVSPQVAYEYVKESCAETSDESNAPRFESGS